MTTATRPTAEQLNEKLASGGFVQVTTYMHSTVYRPKHAGMFFEKNGSLHVKSGRGSNCLSTGENLMVQIRSGRLA
jgi:hypothetical protein